MPTTYAIPNGSTAMGIVLYTGDGSSPRTFTGWNFKPDFIWTKSRNAANDHGLIDSNRGVSGQYLNSDLTHEEWAAGANVTAFTANGYTAITGTNNFTWGNTNGTTYVGWAWNAGSGSNVTNTTGTITSTVSANTTAGFSIVTYTGTGANATVGHGLGVAPGLIIVKNRTSAVQNWAVYNSSLGVNGVLFLNATDAFTSVTGKWSGTNSSVIGLNAASDINQSGSPLVAYCWAPVAGFSQFGSYTGNGSTDFPFIYLGFRLKFWMSKRTDVGAPCLIYD